MKASWRFSVERLAFEHGIVALLLLLSTVFLHPHSAMATPEYRALLTLPNYPIYYTLRDFPLLVRVSPARISGFAYSDCEADGSDVSFADENGKPLSFELDTWDASGESLFWVKIPEIDHRTRLYVRWKDADPPASTATDVWTDYAGVWHSGEASGDLADATGHGLAAAPTGENAETDCVAIDGAIGKARRNATTDGNGSATAYHLTPSYESFDITNKCTVSGWFRASDVVVKNQRFFSSMDDSRTVGFALYLSSASSMVGVNVGGSESINGTETDFQNEWVYISYSPNGATPELYVNGVFWTRKKTLGGSPKNSSLGLAIGGNPSGADKSFRGAFDECRLSKVMRDKNWITVDYKQVTDANFVVSGAAEALGHAAIRVTGAPSTYGEAGYGVHANCTVGTDYTYTAPSTVDLGSGVTANLTGWKVYSAADHTLLRSSADVGESADSVTVTYASPVDVEWQWTLARTADQDVTLYVSPSGRDDADGLTVATALRTPQAAMTLAAGTEESKTTIILCDGRYVAPTNWPHAALYVNKSYVKVTSLNGKDTVILDGTTRRDIKGATNSDSHIRPLAVAASLKEAEICDLTLENGANCNTQANSPSLIFASSGDLHDLVLHGYQRLRCPYIQLNGGAKLRNSTIDAPNAYYDTLGGTTMCVVYMDGKSQLENCVIGNVKSILLTGTSTPQFQAVWMMHKDAVVRGCYIYGMTNGNSSSSALAQGAGIYAKAGIIENCTITKCHALGSGGGIYLNGDVTLVNNVVYGNTATVGNNDIFLNDKATVTYSCADDLSTDETTHNVKANPLLQADGTLSIKSPCAGKGQILSWMTEETLDAAGNARLWTDGTVSMGAYEVQGRYQELSGDFSISGNEFGSVPYDATFIASVANAETFEWDFGDGSAKDTTSGKSATHRYTVPGSYTVTLTARKTGMDPFVITKAGYFKAVGPICYVREGGDGISPYDTWEKATSNLVLAVALQPSAVCVTNGTYAITETTGLYLDVPMRIYSVEGPAVTILDAGGQSRRFATFVDGGATLEGLTFRRNSGAIFNGAGGTVRNCRLRSYGGVWRAECLSIADTRFEDCDFDFAGGYITDTSISCDAVGIKLGGTGIVERCRIYNVTFSYPNNSCSSFSSKKCCGAGVILCDEAKMRNSLVTNCMFCTKDARLLGCGVALRGQSKLENCTIVGNAVLTNAVAAAEQDAGAFGGGVYVASSAAQVNNCLIYGNRRGDKDGDVDFADGVVATSFANNLVRLAEDLPANAVNCISGRDPRFVNDGSGYRVTADSPCYNAGKNLKWCRRKRMSTDIDGGERHCDRPDIGCYEVPRDLGLCILIR